MSSGGEATVNVTITKGDGTYVCVCVFKLGTQAHIHLVSWNCFGLHASMCMSALEGINNQWRDMVWYILCVIG